MYLDDVRFVHIPFQPLTGRVSFLFVSVNCWSFSFFQCKNNANFTQFFRLATCMSFVFWISRIHSQHCLNTVNAHPSFACSLARAFPPYWLWNRTKSSYERKCGVWCAEAFLFTWWNQNSNELHGILPILSFFFYFLHFYSSALTRMMLLLVHPFLSSFLSSIELTCTETKNQKLKSLSDNVICVLCAKNDLFALTRPRFHQSERTKKIATCQTICEFCTQYAWFRDVLTTHAQLTFATPSLCLEWCS